MPKPTKAVASSIVCDHADGLPRHLVAVDMVVRRGTEILLIKRGKKPYSGCNALPGGFVEAGESVEKAATRELLEETGIHVEPNAWMLIGVYSAADRDPRGPVISVAFQAWVPHGVKPIAGDDADLAFFESEWNFQPLAFDHEQIIQDALS